MSLRTLLIASLMRPMLSRGDDVVFLGDERNMADRMPSLSPAREECPFLQPSLPYFFSPPASSSPTDASPHTSGARAFARVELVY